MPQPNALRLVVWITLSSSLLGALFAYAENRPHGMALVHGYADAVS